MSISKEMYNPKTIILLLFLGNFVSGLDRYLINYGIVHISKDLELTGSTTGVIFSSFFLGYAIMQIPGGWLADRFGARAVLIITIIGFSILTGLTGLAWSFTSLVVIRFCFGLAEGSFFPAGAKMISVAIPVDKRSRATSFYLSALMVAGIVAPILATSMLVSIGWRMMFVVIGLFGMLTSLLYKRYLKPKIESQYQKNAHPITKESTAVSKGILKEIIKRPLIWSLMIISFGQGFIVWGVMLWMPTYLVDVRGLDLVTIGILQIIPAATGVLSYVIAGYVLDKVKPGGERWVGAFGAMGLTVIIYLMFNAETVAGVIIYQSIAPILGTVVTVIIVSLPIKRLPESVSGSAVGIVNLGMQVAGFTAPLLIGFSIDMLNGSYTGAVWLMVACGLISFVTFFTLPRFSNLNNVFEPPSTSISK